MTTVSMDNQEELVYTQPSVELWRRRKRELEAWVERTKTSRQPKQTMPFGQVVVDAQLHGALTLFQRLEIPTEFSCAGVSILDEPEDHSLYAYITFLASEKTDRFIKLAMNQMRHRLLVTYEPERKRYDLSSFFISHNRTFCLLMEHCAARFELEEQG